MAVLEFASRLEVGLEIHREGTEVYTYIDERAKNRYKSGSIEFERYEWLIKKEMSDKERVSFREV